MRFVETLTNRAQNKTARKTSRHLLLTETSHFLSHYAAVETHYVAAKVPPRHGVPPAAESQYNYRFCSRGKTTWWRPLYNSGSLKTKIATIKLLLVHTCVRVLVNPLTIVVASRVS